MFKKVALSSKTCAKVCAAIVCGTLAYRNMTTSSPHYAAGYNYSRRFYPAAAEYPDITKNRNIMSRNLSKVMYARLRDLRTPNGFTIDDVIQTGVDNGGTFSFTGCVAGDEETYEVFSELLNKVILERHGHAADDSHPAPDYDGSKLHNGHLDPEFVLSIRMRVIRNLRGYCLPTFCTRGERRDIESVLVKALYAMDEQYKGTYYSLKELNAEEQITLAKNSVWMDRPYLPSEVSCNLGRDWPDSRGIWQNSDRSLVAFLNRRDHIILSLINSGADFKTSFVKFFEFVGRFEESVRAQKWEIMRTKHLGNLTTDPKNLGTALKISVRIKLPKLSKDSRLQALLKSYNLSQSYRIVDELQHSEDDFDLLDEPGKKKESSILEISSIYTLGKSEVEIGQSFIDSINKLIEAEKRLEVDEPLDQQIKSSNLS